MSSVLSAGHRLTSADDFRLAVRRGRRAGGPLVTVHLSAPNVDKEISRPTQVGFVVSKSVGTAVTRNLVKRRLRHLMRERLDTVPAGSLVVVRAQPASAGASYRDLGDALDRCLSRL